MFSMPDDSVHVTKPVFKGGKIADMVSLVAPSANMLNETKKINGCLPELIDPDSRIQNDSRDSSNCLKRGPGPDRVEEDVKTLAIATDLGFKIHPVYETSADQFSPPLVGPPLGKLLRNNFFFDVIVGDVASPSNFYVRNYRTSKALQTLETQMSHWYEHEMKPVQLKMEHLTLHGHFVLKKNDKFYRVKVVPPFNRKGEKVMVNFLDYGGFAQVEPQQLLPLRKAYLFLQTQAWKAKLQVPSWPPTIKWSPEDCTRFKNEVEGKSLVALILGESIDDFTNERCLGCVLVDTKGNKDVYVHLQLNDSRMIKTC